MIQQDETRFTLRISTRRSPYPGELGRFQKAIEMRLGSGVDFHIKKVDYIPFEPSGKYLLCHSLLHTRDKRS